MGRAADVRLDREPHRAPLNQSQDGIYMVEWLKEALGGSCFDSNSSTGGCRHRSEFAQFYAGCTFGPSVACAVGSLPCNAWFWSAHCYWRRVLFHPLPLRTTTEFAPRSTAHMKFISVRPKRLLQSPPGHAEPARFDAPLATTHGAWSTGSFWQLFAAG